MGHVPETLRDRLERAASSSESEMEADRQMRTRKRERIVHARESHCGQASQANPSPVQLVQLAL